MSDTGSGGGGGGTGTGAGRRGSGQHGVGVGAVGGVRTSTGGNYGYQHQVQQPMPYPINPMQQHGGGMGGAVGYYDRSPYQPPHYGYGYTHSQMGPSPAMEYMPGSTPSRAAAYGLGHHGLLTYADNSRQRQHQQPPQGQASVSGDSYTHKMAEIPKTEGGHKMSTVTERSTSSPAVNAQLENAKEVGQGSCPSPTSMSWLLDASKVYARKSDPETAEDVKAKEGPDRRIKNDDVDMDNKDKNSGNTENEKDSKPPIIKLENSRRPTVVEDVKERIGEAVRKSMGPVGSNGTSDSDASWASSSSASLAPTPTMSSLAAVGERHSARTRRKRQVFDPSDVPEASADADDVKLTDQPTPSTAEKESSGPSATKSSKTVRCISCDQYMRNRLKFRSCQACATLYHVDCVKRIDNQVINGKMRWECIADGCQALNEDFDSFEDLMQHRQREGKINLYARNRTESAVRSRPSSGKPAVITATGSPKRTPRARRAQRTPALPPRAETGKFMKAKTEWELGGNESDGNPEAENPRSRRRRSNVSYAEPEDPSESEEDEKEDAAEENGDEDNGDGDGGQPMEEEVEEIQKSPKGQSNANESESDDINMDGSVGKTSDVAPVGSGAGSEPDKAATEKIEFKQPETGNDIGKSPPVSTTGTGTVDHAWGAKAVSDWSVNDVRAYFILNGLGKEAHILYRQEIDGLALLLMTRQDIVHGMKFLMGPALKIHRIILELQLNEHANIKTAGSNATGHGHGCGGGDSAGGSGGKCACGK